MRLALVTSCFSLIAVTSLALAQQAPPPQQPYPQGYPPYPYPPPPGYPYPPYPYPPPPGYYAQPPPPPPPAELPYDETEPVPPGYRVESKVRRGPIIAGSIMLGTTYLVNVMVASVGDSEVATWMYVPGIGTWPLTAEVCEEQNAGAGCEVLVVHSITHTAGLALLIYGIAAPKQRLVRDASVRVVPMPLASGGGLGLSGQF